MKFLFLAFILFGSPAFAGEDTTPADKLIDMELNQSNVQASGPSIVVNTRPAEGVEEVKTVKIPKETVKELQNAVVLDEDRDIKGEIKEIKVEIGADHDPRNYPKFLASVFTLNFDNPRISLEEIVDGGVVVDEIPALVNPLIIPISEAEEYLHYTDNEYMAVVEINGDARAYPLRVLNWHQGVNDEIGGQPVFVVYDPLSGNIIALDRRVTGKKETTFGVTGQVYKSASLYYDRATKSVWAPFENMAVAGSLVGQKMKRYRSTLTTWKSFKETYPKGVVLDMMNTGYDRSYRQNPYGDYALTKQMLFPVAYTNESLPRKEYVVGVRMFKGSRRIEVAVPVNALLNMTKPKIDLMFDEVQVLGSKSIPLTYEVVKPYGAIKVTSSDPDVILEKFYGYWLVWAAHNPNTRVITTLE